MRWPDKKKTSYEDEETEQIYLELYCHKIWIRTAGTEN